MKKLALLALATVSILTGCTTDQAGNTSFDSKAFHDVVSTGMDVYGQYQSSQQPRFDNRPYVDSHGNVLYVH